MPHPYCILSILMPHKMKQNTLFPCLTKLIKHYCNASPSSYTINPNASRNETDIEMPHQIKIEFLMPHQMAKCPGLSTFPIPTANTNSRHKPALYPSPRQAPLLYSFNHRRFCEAEKYN